MYPFIMKPIEKRHILSTTLMINGNILFLAAYDKYFINPLESQGRIIFAYPALQVFKARNENNNAMP